MKTNFVLFLKNELHRRVESNPNYSLRAFAGKLGVSSGTLCDLFQNKRPLTLKNFEKMVPYFKLEEEQVEHFRTWVKNSSEEKATFSSFDSDQSSLFNSPLQAAMVELLHIEDFQDNISLLADKLNITTDQCEHILNLFVEHNILDKFDKGHQISKGSSLTKNAFPLDFFKQVIQNAYDKIDVLNPSEHLSLASAYAINPADLPAIKKEIANFHSKLTYWNEKRKNKESVFFLNINFTPY